jgi:predicted TIM-barrel enzyme
MIIKTIKGMIVGAIKKEGVKEKPVEKEKTVEIKKEEAKAS